MNYLDSPRSESGLNGLLQFDRDNGQLLLTDYRMLIISARSVGLLRKDLIEELGREQASGFLKRFGYSAGLADALAFRKSFPKFPLDRQNTNGLLLQAVNGMLRFVTVPEKCRIDLAANRFHLELQGENSYEADQHLEIYGKSDKAVCWTIAGYASGYLSSTVGKKILVTESDCRATGHDHCYFIADFEENCSSSLRQERWHSRPFYLPELYEDLQKTIVEQQQSLLEKQQTIAQLQTQLDAKNDFAIHGIVGESETLHKALAMARLAAPVDSTVLLLGESGTGKELLAHGIHNNSLRADKPFIAVNCNAMPETLQDAELFGYRQGAFTGAESDHTGLFESADGGTLLLDEIGDLTPAAQTKILRALQGGEIRRIGETRTRKVDVRIIAATNRDLEKMVEDKTFRADLYYRLNVVSIKLPPLRERGGDPLLLAEHFVKRYTQKFGKRKIRKLSPEATSAVMEYPWPGNVRELKHALERAVILSPGPEIGVDELPEKVTRTYYRNRSLTPPLSTPRFDPESRLTLIEDESERLRMALNLVKGNREKAAALLGISRTTLWRRMQKLREEEGQ